MKAEMNPVVAAAALSMLLDLPVPGSGGCTVIAPEEGQGRWVPPRRAPESSYPVEPGVKGGWDKACARRRKKLAARKRERQARRQARRA